MIRSSSYSSTQNPIDGNCMKRSHRVVNSHMTIYFVRQVYSAFQIEKSNIFLADNKMPTRECWTAFYPAPEDQKGSRIIKIDFEMTF